MTWSPPLRHPFPPRPPPCGFLARFSTTALPRGSPHRLALCVFCFDTPVVAGLSLSEPRRGAACLWNVSSPRAGLAAAGGRRVGESVTSPLPPLLFQFGGEAGARSPRSSRTRSRGPPARTAGRAASPATRGRMPRRSSSSCEGHGPRRPCRRLAATERHQGHPRLLGLVSPRPRLSSASSRCCFLCSALSMEPEADPLLGDQHTCSGFSRRWRSACAFTGASRCRGHT